VDQAAKTLGVDADTLRAINGIPKGMRIRSGSTVLVPKTSRRPGDISLAMAENASLSLDKPAPPAPKKCAKGAKCPVVKSKKGATKGNSSANNAASQHKSASTGLAKSAKNGVANASVTPVKVVSGKGVSKTQ
jgi:membrane-bound lytic murein transglycosylase D